MRIFVIYLSATWLCCGFFSFASAQSSWSQGPTPAPQLSLAPNAKLNEADRASDRLSETSESTAKPSPFDLFSNEPEVTSIISEPDDSGSESADIQAPEQPTALGTKDRSPRQVDSLSSNYTLENIRYSPPIDWMSYRRHAPNHTADYMLLQWCADGLWDNYAAERDARCALQARRIAGYHHSTHGGRVASCYSSGVKEHCGHAACSQCNKPAYYSQHTTSGYIRASSPSHGSVQYSNNPYPHQSQQIPQSSSSPFQTPHITKTYSIPSSLTHPPHAQPPIPAHQNSGKVASQMLNWNR